MESTDDRTFADVAEQFEEWREEEEAIAKSRKRHREFWQLLRDYRAGLLTDEEAHDRLVRLRIREFLAGNVDGTIWMLKEERRKGRGA